MTTDITELAQREKFEAWWERTQHNGNPPRFGWPHWRDGEGYKVDDDDSELDGMWSAWKEAGAELVEALEKSELRLHEVAVACATAEQALEKAQRANAAQDDHINQQQDRIEWLEKGNQYAGKRIAELESRTVKLPELCVGVVQGGHAVMVPYPAGHWFNKTEILEMLTAAGIKWEAE
ncbi:hypothetical protein RRQ98_005222 [Klebsiella pneumoniae]|nr:hypothetical protein [Klebsiella pneumoniae]